MNYIILAPHIDDELIGCFSLIKDKKVKKVIYFFETTPERLEEAKEVSKHYGFEIEFSTIDDFKPEFNENDIILLPQKTDSHSHHKQVNQLKWKIKNKKKFYSIDMKNAKPLPLSVINEKEKALKKFYPSQINLFENAKYFLFEDIIDEDDKKMIWVTFQKKGIHYYPAAASDEKLQDVSYLGHPHRHLFKFKVSIEVFHNDRDIEFHQFLNYLEGLYENNILELDFKSCEMIADDLAFHIANKFPGRKFIVDVSEDGEVGTTCEYN